MPKTRPAALPEAQKLPILSGFCAGGAEGGRTPDLLIANEALSQLSYGPVNAPARAQRPKSVAVGALASARHLGPGVCGVKAAGRIIARRVADALT